MINFFLPLFQQDEYRWWHVELFNHEHQLAMSYQFFGSESTVCQSAKNSPDYHSFRITPSFEKMNPWKEVPGESESEFPRNSSIKDSKSMSLRELIR